MIRFHAPCDHSHWAHYRLQHLCPLKYLSENTVITLSVPGNDHTVWLVCKCSLEPGAGPFTSLAHHTILACYLQGHPRIAQEKQWEERPGTSCYHGLDTWHELIWYLVLGTRSIPGSRSMHKSVGPLQNQASQLQCWALEECGPKGTERN